MSNVVENEKPTNVTVMDAADKPGSAIVTLISSGVTGIPATVPEPFEPIPFNPLQEKICDCAALVASTHPAT